MPNKNKAKGTYHEKWLVEWLEDRGFNAKRQPLSGSLGGEWSGDLILNLLGHRLGGEMTMTKGTLGSKPEDVPNRSS